VAGFKVPFTRMLFAFIDPSRYTVKPSSIIILSVELGMRLFLQVDAALKSPFLIHLIVIVGGFVSVELLISLIVYLLLFVWNEKVDRKQKKRKMDTFSFSFIIIFY
jgi:hypothetical protein